MVKVIHKGFVFALQRLQPSPRPSMPGKNVVATNILGRLRGLEIVRVRINAQDCIRLGAKVIANVLFE